MGVKIGDKATIGDGNAIGDNATVRIENKDTEKSSWFMRHPVFSGIISSFVVGCILLFSFWSKFIKFIEGLLK